jgi:hypothetical protein
LSTPTKGLLLTLGGAPADVPHTISPLPGYYLSNVPHPVGDGCDLTLEQAEQADVDMDVVELVDIAVDQVEPAQATHVAHARQGRKTLAEAGRSRGRKDNPERLEDERAALQTKAGE